MNNLKVGFSKGNINPPMGIQIRGYFKERLAEGILDDIEVETKSETRKLIEKFVDENPEAAANVLRNWLNEDWGM